MATPGAGKTTFALRIAAELLADGTVDAVTVVTPTEHLKNQWARRPRRVGIQLDPTFRNADVHTARDFHGAVVTYAQVGHGPGGAPARAPLTGARWSILDEIHHAGDSRSWGDGGAGGVRAGGPAADADRDAVPLGREPDPVRPVRARPGRRCCGRGRPRVRVRRRAAGRRGPAGDLPGVLRGDPVADQGRRRAGRPARRADDPGRRAGLADRAGPGRRLDAAGAAGGRRAAVPGRATAACPTPAAW